MKNRILALLLTLAANQLSLLGPRYSGAAIDAIELKSGVDFAAVWDALTQAGYRGDYVLEAHHQTIEAKDEERDAILKEILRRSRRVRDQLARGERITSVK